VPSPESENPSQPAILNLYDELRRRKVVKVAVVYAAAAWVVLQFADMAFPRIGLPDWTITLALAMAAIGFPLALVLAWAFETTPDGIRRDSRTGPAPQRPGRVRDLLMIAAFTLAVGYLYLDRFIDAPNDVQGEASTAAASEPADASSPSIAVLPFDNLSPDEENAFFAAGIHEDILSHLSKIDRLKVISRTSVMRYAGTTENLKEIAEALGVSTILEGSVRRSGNRVRITVQLIDAATDQHLWAENFDRDLTDIFAIQSEVARSVADQLRVELALDVIQRIESVPTTNLVAYDLYLEGRALIKDPNTPDADAAIGLFERATTLDPQFAQAYAGLARALFYQSTAVGWMEVREPAMRAATMALSLNEESSDAHLAMGTLLHHPAERNFADAAKHLERAIALDPNNAEAHFQYAGNFMLQSQFSQASDQLKIALRLDPLSVSYNTVMAMMLALGGRGEEAFSYLERAIQLEPQFALSYQIAGNVSQLLGDHVQSTKYRVHAHNLDPGNIQLAVILIYDLLALGESEAADRLIKEIQAAAPSHDLVFSITADFLASQGRQAERRQTIARWRAAIPESLALSRYAGSALAADGISAAIEEETERADELFQQSYTKLVTFMAPYESDTGYAVNWDNAWGALTLASVAARLGNTELSERTYQGILDYSVANGQVGNFWAQLFHRAMVHAYRGDHTEAIDEFELARMRGGNWVWLFGVYNITDDQLGTFDGLANNVGLITLLDTMRRDNAETVARLREDNPEIFLHTDAEHIAAPISSRPLAGASARR
jgi:TolB-like protein/Tfp pilus assembly protein PilF